MRTRNDRCEIVDAPQFVGVLQQQTEGAGLQRHRVHRSHAQVDAERLCTRAHDFDRLRQASVADQAHRART